MRKLQSIFLLLSITLFAWIYYFSIDYPEFNNLRIMGMIGLIQWLISVWSWKREKRELISPYIFLLLSIYVFSFGQSLLYTFDVVSKSRDLLGHYGITKQNLFEAQMLTIIMLSFFHIGGLLSLKNESRIHNNHLNVDNSNSIIKFGWIVFIISLIPFWYITILDSINSMSFGYASLYKGKNIVGFSSIYIFISDYYVPSLICLYVGYRKNKRMRNVILGIFFIIISLKLLTGGRTEAVIIVLLLILLHNYVIKTISSKGLVYLGIASIFAFSILTIVSDLRSKKNRDIKSYLEFKTNENTSLNSIAEMGGTMSCLIWTQRFVPSSENYRYGRSYLFSFTTLFPNLGFWEMHPARKESNLGDWLTKKMHLSYGTGYSMCAEAYINFGYFSWVIMLFMGYLFGRLFEDSHAAFYHHSLKLIFALIIFWFSIKLARNSFIGFVRAFFYYALPIYLIVKNCSGNNLFNKFSKVD